MQDIMSFHQKETRQDIWAKYDPKKAIEGIRKSKGALTGVDSAALKRDIRDQHRKSVIVTDCSSTAAFAPQNLSA